MHEHNLSISESNITDVKLRIVDDGKDGLLAWASCVVNNSIFLNNIAVRRSRDGSLFLTYPAKRTSGGERYQVFNPISVQAANTIQNAVLARLAVLAKAAAAGSTDTR